MSAMDESTSEGICSQNSYIAISLDDDSLNPKSETGCHMATMTSTERGVRYLLHLCGLSYGLEKSWMFFIKKYLLEVALPSLQELPATSALDKVACFAEVAFREIFVDPADSIKDMSVTASNPKPMPRKMRERLFLDLVSDEFNMFFARACKEHKMENKYFPFVIPPVYKALQRQDVLRHFNFPEAAEDKVMRKANVHQAPVRIHTELKRHVSSLVAGSAAFCFEHVPARLTSFPKQNETSPDDLKYITVLKQASERKAHSQSPSVSGFLTATGANTGAGVDVNDRQYAHRDDNTDATCSSSVTAKTHRSDLDACETYVAPTPPRTELQNHQPDTLGLLMKLAGIDTSEAAEYTTAGEPEKQVCTSVHFGQQGPAVPPQPTTLDVFCTPDLPHPVSALSEQSCAHTYVPQETEKDQLRAAASELCNAATEFAVMQKEQKGSNVEVETTVPEQPPHCVISSSDGSADCIQSLGSQEAKSAENKKVSEQHVQVALSSAVTSYCSQNAGTFLRDFTAAARNLKQVSSAEVRGVYRSVRGVKKTVERFVLLAGKADSVFSALMKHGVVTTADLVFSKLNKNKKFRSLTTYLTILVEQSAGSAGAAATFTKPAVDVPTILTKLKRVLDMFCALNQCLESATSHGSPADEERFRETGRRLLICIKNLNL